MSLSVRRETILRELDALCEDGDVPSAQKLGRLVGLSSKSSISLQLQRLAEDGLVRHVDIRGYQITERGQRVLAEMDGGA